MCIAAPGKIKKIEGQKVYVEYPGEVRPALAGGEPVKVGDFVLVQMGIVIQILSPEEAAEANKAWISQA